MLLNQDHDFCVSRSVPSLNWAFLSNNPKEEHGLLLGTGVASSVVKTEAVFTFVLWGRVFCLLVCIPGTCRGQWDSFWNWCCRRLGTAMWVLGAKSETTTSILYHWAVSPAPNSILLFILKINFLAQGDLKLKILLPQLLPHMGSQEYTTMPSFESQTWWLRPVVPVFWEVEAGGAKL